MGNLPVQEYRARRRTPPPPGTHRWGRPGRMDSGMNNYRSLRSLGVRFALAILLGRIICCSIACATASLGMLTLIQEAVKLVDNVVVKPALFEEYRLVILNNHFLAIQGRLQSDEGVINVVAEKVKALPQINNEKSLHLHARNFH